MIDARFVPLATWPGKRGITSKLRSPFKVSYGKVLAELERELRHLGAVACLFEIDVRADQLRLDGGIRAGERAGRPGLVLSFKSKYGPMRLACDAFVKNEDNLRAISLHLTNLRLASLYGVGASGEQYTGWLRIEAGAAPTAPTMSPLEAFRVLIRIVEPGVSDAVLNFLGEPKPELAESYKTSLRKALAVAHPDANAGDRSKWDQLQLQRAKAVLDAHHGIAKNAGGA